MTLKEFLDKVKDLPPDTLLCTAEVEEAFGANVAAVEIVEDAKVDTLEADGREAIGLANGKDSVVVIRW